MAKQQPSPAKQLTQILSEYSNVYQYSDTKRIVEANTSMVTAIQRLAPKGTFYYDSLEAATKNYFTS